LSFARFLDHFMGQILAGVMTLRIDGGIEPLLAALIALSTR
jgi:hypothetical protein